MNFKELISKRRACKLFNDKKINEKDLHFILESGVLAPSSHGFALEICSIRTKRT